MFARSRLFDAILPLGVFIGEMLLQRNGYDYPELESYLDMPVILPHHDILSVFGDKVQFAQWMESSGFGRYIPQTFLDIDHATFPILIKQSNGVGGNGSFVVNNMTEYHHAIKTLGGLSYVMQEAVPGADECSIQVVARKGTLAGIFCVYYHQNDDGVYVRNGIETVPDRITMPCVDFEKVSPVLSIVRDIVRVSEYNGLFCINFKLVRTQHDGTRTPVNFSTFTTAIPQRTPLVMSDFSNLPKFFEINPRACGPMSMEPENLSEMVRLYIEHM